MSNESANSDDDSLGHVMSAESETGSGTGSNTGEETEEDLKKKLEELKKKKKSKIGKSNAKVKSTSKTSKDKVKSKFMKGLDKLNLLAQERSQQQKGNQKQSSKIKEIKSLTTKEERLPIDKSKLRYSQTNLQKSKSKVLYDMKAEESISNLLNRRQSPKPLFKTNSFTAKEYVDKGTAKINQIETDQNIELRETKPVVAHHISPEKMTESLHTLVKHLYKNKQTLDVNQINKQDAKSTIKFTLSSFINEDGASG